MLFLKLKAITSIELKWDNLRDLTFKIAETDGTKQQVKLKYNKTKKNKDQKI